MSIELSVKEPYIIQRINDWYLDTAKGIIYGNTKTFGINFEIPVKGNVEGYVDKHIMARVNCYLYAFVPGNIRADKVQYKCQYFNYLNLKNVGVDIII